MTAKVVSVVVVVGGVFILLHPGSMSSAFFKGGTGSFTTEILTHIYSCHNISPLSSVQILLLPARCLLYVL